MNICIIPARGGSKRIARKNIKDFNGRPIIAYAIEAALKSELFSEVMVSTEDDEIANISRIYGATVPFMRSEKNADDFTGPGDVVFEVLTKYSELGQQFDQCCCIYATSPLMTIPRLIEGLQLLNSSEHDVVFPVGKYSSPIWRSYKLDAESGVRMNFPEYEKSRSQDLLDTYFDAGQFYWFHTQNIFNIDNKNTFGKNKGVIILDDIEVQDIDNLDDWQVAEIKQKYLMRKIMNNV
jgi:pseudaminic acid cytidylyltransferase